MLIGGLAAIVCELLEQDARARSLEVLERRLSTVRSVKRDDLIDHASSRVEKCAALPIRA